MRRRDRGVGRRILAGALLLGLSVPGAGAVAPDSEGRLLVLNKTDGTLLVLDVPSYQRLATIGVGAEPHEVVVTPDGRKAYTSNVRDRSLSVVDLKAYKVVKTIRSPMFDYPHGLGITADGRRLLLTSEGSHRLVLIDTARDVVLRTLTTNQQGSHMVTLLKGDRRAYVANRKSDTISEISVPDLKIVRNLKVGAGPEGIASTANGRWLLVALQGSDQLAILHNESREPVARVPTGATPVRVAVTPNSFTALVSNRASNDVTVIDLLERRVKATVRVGLSPGGIVSNAQGTRAYVCNNGSNSVSVISIAGGEVTETLPAGAGPDGVAFVPNPGPARQRGAPRVRRPVGEGS